MTTYASFPSKWLPAAALGLSAFLMIPLAGCKGNAQSSAPIVDGSAANGGDPAAANLAPVDGTQPTQVMGQSQSYSPQQQSQAYPQQEPAPIEQNYGGQAPSNGDYDQGYQDGEASVEANQAPPPLPEYDQPPAPEPNDLWTPGYWDYDNGDGYYWVPGAWVAAPYYGALWTPAYWDFYGGHYRFHNGYWGRHIGYYGGINYGFGYSGVGYEGGYWQGNSFYYNRDVNRVNNSNIRNVYSHPVANNNGRGRISYNGGPGGIQARPQAAELAARREQHTAPMQTQVTVRNEAAHNRNQSFNSNHGRPAQAVAARPIPATPGIAAPPERQNPAGRPGEMNRPGQPGNNNRPGEMTRPGQLGNNNRPGEMTRPGQPGNNNRPGEMTRPGQPGNNRPGEVNRPGQPAVTPQQRPQEQQRPQNQSAPNRAVPEQGRPGFNPQQHPAQPAPNHVTPQQQNRPEPNHVTPQPNQPNTHFQRPEQARPAQQPRPGEPQRMAPERPAEAPRPQPAPRAEAPRPQPAPRAEAPRPQPAPHAEAPRPAPAPRPAAQPHPEGGHAEHPH